MRFRFPPWCALTILVPLLLAIAACASDAPVKSRLPPGAGGISLRDGAVRGPGTMANHLHATLADTAEGDVRIGAGAGAMFETRWRLEGARPTKLALEAGRAVYRDALEHADVLWTADEDRAEVFVRLRDEAAPTTFRWRVGLGTGLKNVVAESDGGVSFVDASGRKRLRVGAAFAVDARGTRRDAAVRWNDGVVSLGVDTRGLVYPVLVDPPLETVTWELAMAAGAPQARQYAAAAYDSARGKTVLFGGMDQLDLLDDTWEWDGLVWTQMSAAPGPPPLYGQAMAYDSARGKMVLFGGQDDWQFNSYSAETWEWDGTVWTHPQPATHPPGRGYSAMAYDSARSRIVLYGGHTVYGDGFADDTWEYDGTTWTPKTPAHRPTKMAYHVMAYDAARGRTLLFGGTGAAGDNLATWEWDGTDWTQATPLASPGARRGPAVAFDETRSKAVLFGGEGQSPEIGSETWEWDGTTWTVRTPDAMPPGRSYAAAAFDSARGVTVMVGGGDSGVGRDDTWEWDGTNWSMRSPVGRPPARGGTALVFDPVLGNAILYGGWDHQLVLLDDLWTWDGAAWHAHTPDVKPPPRQEFAMAFDEARGVAVLFGGSLSGQFLADTWEWDGTSWNLRTPQSHPPARSGHRMAYDPVRKEVVLFGGWGTSGQTTSETWEWDGSAWSQKTHDPLPSECSAADLFYDPHRGSVLMRCDNYPVGFWAWDGTSWTNVDASPMPGECSTRSLAYDTRRSRVVSFDALFDGVGDVSFTCEWDGSSWLVRAPLTSPPPKAAGPIVFDSVRNETVMFGWRGETWVYRGWGGGCTTSAECDTGFCVDGVCCTTECGGGDPNDCQACSVALGAASDGVCAVVASGTACSDSDPCTEGDACQDGACVSGGPATCPPEDGCHDAGTCEPSMGGCAHLVKPDGTACDDGDSATQDDACTAGLCAGINRCAGVTCAPADDCHDAACHPLTGACLQQARPDNTPCALGACLAGVCVSPQVTDAGAADAGSADANSPEAGPADDNSSGPDTYVAGGGCGCSTTRRTSGSPGSHALLLSAAAYLALRRRRSRQLQ